MDPSSEFEHERKQRIASYAQNKALQDQAQAFLHTSLEAKYSFNFTWLGRPVIQHPQDLLAMQEVVWKVKPDFIIETGIAHGGSLIFYASMLALLGGRRRVVGIDVDVRSHNRDAIEQHPLAKYITLLEGSSTDEETVRQVRDIAKDSTRILVSLDSNHTHEHVLAELNSYADLVTEGSYMIVFDGIIETMPLEYSDGRPWGPGNSPLTAIQAFLAERDDFEIDHELEDKLLVSAAPSGYLRRLRSAHRQA